MVHPDNIGYQSTEQVQNQLVEKAETEKIECLKMLEDMKAQLYEFEKMETVFYKKQQELAQMIDGVTLERDVAQATEANSRKEIEMLQSKLDEVHSRTRETIEKEVDRCVYSANLTQLNGSSRAQFSAQREKLIQEINNLEGSRAQLQALMERAVREKRAAENELDRLTSSYPVELERLSRTIDDLTCKLRSSELTKIEMTRQVDNYKNRLIKEENKFEADKAQLSNLSQDAFRKLRKSEADLEDTKVFLFNYLRILTVRMIY